MQEDSSRTEPVKRKKVFSRYPVTVQHKAFELWLTSTSLTNREISEKIGVPYGTLRHWMNAGKWQLRKRALAEKLAVTLENDEVNIVRAARIPIVRRQLDNITAADTILNYHLSDQVLKIQKKIIKGEKVDIKELSSVASIILRTQKAADNITGDRRAIGRPPIPKSPGIVQMGGIIQVGLQPIRKVEKAIEAEVKEVQDAIQERITETVPVDVPSESSEEVGEGISTPKETPETQKEDSEELSQALQKALGKS